MKSIGLGPKAGLMDFTERLAILAVVTEPGLAGSPRRQVQRKKCGEILQTTAGLRMTVGGCAKPMEALGAISNSW